MTYKTLSDQIDIEVERNNHARCQKMAKPSCRKLCAECIASYKLHSRRVILQDITNAKILLQKWGYTVV